ncbi:MAG: STM4013/SEN3800 family hydrolase [Pirellulales bacterium]|nr:STM4013/SEN3800 family hydrolase [Pirellulales bacterium]
MHTKPDDQQTVVDLPWDMAELVGEIDFLLITLDTLRFDAAQDAWCEGRLTTLAPYLGSDGWERRHTPGTFTYAAHHAFFSGFLPTRADPGLTPRLFAPRFPGSETTTSRTFVFEEPTLPEALAARGYRTICIGGTGFFNPASALGRVLPGLFSESHWRSEFGVTDRRSERNQIECAMDRLAEAGSRRTFLFVNISAIHQPNWFYGSQTNRDTLQTHKEALIAVDRALAPLFELCQQRGRTFCVVCSDHGTAYGEDGHHGHRVAHEVVWNVPYAEFLL